MATYSLWYAINDELSARLGAFALAVSLLLVATTLPASGTDSGALALSISPKRALVTMAFVGALARRAH
ncbi:MAG: hypothetical protein ABEH83_03600 [Halobacterium sp.]